MTHLFRKEIRRLLLGGAGALAIGLAIGEVAWVLLAAAAGYLGWHLLQFRRLAAWIERGRPDPIPELGGSWRGIGQPLVRMSRHNRKRKKRLRKLVNRFRQAAEATPDGAVILRSGGEILWLNGAAHRLLGLRHPQDLEQPIANLLRDPDFVEYLAAGDFSEPLELPSPALEGTYLLIRIVPYGSGRRLLLARDITRLHHLEQMRRDFVANVSHELRSPLTVLVGYLESLGDDEEAPPHFRRPLAQMSQQAQRMCHIVEDLLRLSRLENDPGGAPQEVVDVPAMLARVREDASKLSAGCHRIHLEVDREVGLLGDYNELYSAFSNLAFNAVQYTPGGGEVRIGWDTGEAGGRLWIRDSGVGIEAHHVPRLTERFYRADKARSREVGGTGLGLAIVKHVLMRHEARLHIESELGVGSTFECRFPASRLARLERPALVAEA